MADKKENLIEEEVKETKKATRKKKSDEEGAKSTAKKPRKGKEGAEAELTEEEKAQAMKAYNEQFSNPYRAAELGFIDEIIMPRQTRYKLIQALEMAKNKSPSNPPKKHGNMPL